MKSRSSCALAGGPCRPPHLSGRQARQEPDPVGSWEGGGVPGRGRGSSAPLTAATALAPRPRAGLGDRGGPAGQAARVALHGVPAEARTPLLRRHPDRAELRAVGRALSERHVSVPARPHLGFQCARRARVARAVLRARGGAFRRRREGLQVLLRSGGVSPPLPTPRAPQSPPVPPPQEPPVGARGAGGT